MHPVYQESALVSRAVAASRLIVTTSNHLSGVLQSSAQNFTQKTKANPKPLTFTPVTQERVRKINSFTGGAAGLSSKTVSQVSKYAQNLGATMTRRGRGKAGDGDAKTAEGSKPGILNKSMMAFVTVADGIDQGARNLLTSGSSAATTVIGHRYGDEAKEVTRQLTGGVTNVGLVYIDAAGVSRKAVIKSVAKGMVLGKVKGGGEVVVGGDDGHLAANVPPYTATASHLVGTEGPVVSGVGLAGTTEVGFGNAAPPVYGAGVGEPLGGTGLQGHESDIKR